jgi:ubiquinone/menaquinone biosynthesis C-methylase UbiE
VAGSKFVARDGDGYERQMGRWSRRLAVRFLDFAGCSPGEHVLDLGCGTGSLSAEISERSGSAEVVGLDYSAVYARYARDNAGAGTRFLAGDGGALPFRDDVFDSSMALLVLHFVPQPDRAIAEMRRVTRPGGAVAAAVWDSSGGVVINRLFCDTAAALDPRGEEFRQTNSSRPMTHEGELEESWRQAGLHDVEASTLTVRMQFEAFEDYWGPYAGQDGPYAAYVASLEVAAQRDLAVAVRRAYLSGRPDGPRSFTASAWAVRGRVPM